MKKKLLILMLVILVLLCGCKKVYEIESFETAFVVPLEGDTTNQGAFDSAKFLNETKVAAKRVIITESWRRSPMGWYPDAKLYTVNRKTVTREWTEDDGTGSSKKNEAIKAESKESISFTARLSCAANIAEKDAATFLYNYPSSISLSQVMDTEIRTKAGGEFIKACSDKSMSEIITGKRSILNEVFTEVKTYFAKKGISVTVLEYAKDFQYDDKAIQASINAKFTAANKLEAQAAVNERVISEAKAKQKAIDIQKDTISKTLEMKKLENQADAISKWDGKMPNYTGSGGSIFQIPLK